MDSWRLFWKPTGLSGLRFFSSSVWEAASQPDAGFPPTVPQTGMAPHTLNCRPEGKSHTGVVSYRTWHGRNLATSVPACHAGAVKS